MISKYQPREMLAGQVSKRIPRMLSDAGLNNNISALCHPFSYPRLVQKNHKTQGFLLSISPSDGCYSINNHNVHSFLSSLGSVTCGQRAVEIPLMLHLSPLGRLANNEIYWPIYVYD
jgi:hypothetical protein